jgi:hypothetical protein
MHGNGKIQMKKSMGPRQEKVTRTRKVEIFIATVQV